METWNWGQLNDYQLLLSRFYEKTEKVQLIDNP